MIRQASENESHKRPKSSSGNHRRFRADFFGISINFLLLGIALVFLSSPAHGCYFMPVLGSDGEPVGGSLICDVVVMAPISFGGGGGGGGYDWWLITQMLGQKPILEPEPLPDRPPLPIRPIDPELRWIALVAVDSAKNWLNSKPDCNSFISLSKWKSGVVDPDSVTQTLDNVMARDLFFPLGGSQGLCATANAYACPAEVGKTCRDGIPGGSITLCDSFFNKNDTEQVRIILHEVWHLYGETHEGPMAEIQPYLDSVPYNMALVYECKLPCLNDGYTCTPGAVP